MKKSIYSDDYRLFLQKLIELRLSKSIKQSELAVNLNVPQSFVSKYETGERRLDIIELNEILKHLDSSIVDFITDLSKELCGSKQEL
ncbi:MAG: helix-turn-helix transcriptional regulator [Chlorobi bacterium]|nr:helix-turn-helix transcriptional regulator [Chlorobiota bacterium]